MCKVLGEHSAYVERTHLTSRHMNGRLVRKTFAFSKDRQMLEASCAWEDWAYNLTRPVKTLREEVKEGNRRWRPRSPAMAAGLTDHIWTIEELLSTVVMPKVVNTGEGDYLFFQTLMNMKQSIAGCALLFSINMMAQTKVNNDLMTWWNTSGNYSLSEKTSISSLYSFRRADFVANWQQSLFRIGLNYKATKNTTLTSGYDWVITFPYGKQPIAKKTTEHRIFEQITLNQSAWKLNIKHRYRFEQRFFNNSIPTKHRFRYRLGVSVPISKNEKLLVQFFDEVFLNYGKEANNHIFDQNWAYGGLAYDLTKNVVLKIGYMNQYILKSDNIRTENNSTLQFGITLKK